MGGVEKGLQLLRGRPLAAWVIERLEPQVAAVLVNANQNAEAYAKLGKPVVADCVGGFAGPLAGVHAGMHACPTPLLACVPCDAPFLPHDLVARLQAGLEGAAADAAMACAAGREQPVFALVRRELASQLGKFLAGGGRSMGAWLASLRLAKVDFDDAAAFANVNTREELERFQS